jgi:catechol 2,3-dioxygenase-like lactoylglutathione lyase family enzyme
MSTAHIEHVNLTVSDLEATAQWLITALPHWRVRGQGQVDWFGQQIRWMHVGDDHTYLALQEGAQGEPLDWRDLKPGVKHIGLVVDSLDAAVSRLEQAGHALDHWGGETAWRRSVYLIAPGGLQFELVEYRSADPALRNDYAA